MADSIDVAPEVSRKNERMRFMFRLLSHTAGIVRQRIGKTVKAMIQILGKLLLCQPGARGPISGLPRSATLERVSLRSSQQIHLSPRGSSTAGRNIPGWSNVIETGSSR